MNFEGKNFYFVGIGGIGMSAIARFFKHNNHFVAGYDLTETQLTRNLVSEGVSVNYCDEIETIDKKIAEEKNNEIRLSFEGTQLIGPQALSLIHISEPTRPY